MKQLFRKPLSAEELTAKAKAAAAKGLRPFDLLKIAIDRIGREVEQNAR